MDFLSSYTSKLRTPAQAVRLIKSGDWVDYGFCAGHPVELDQALAQRMTDEPSLTNLNLRGGVPLWQPAVTKLPDASTRLTWNSWHWTGVERRLMNQGFVFYAPIRFAETPRYYREGAATVDVAMLQVSPMDRAGNFSFSAGTAHAAALCACATTVVVEVNANMPRLDGVESTIHIDDVDVVVEGENAPLGTLSTPPSTEDDQAVARQIVAHIPNGASLQLGIGGMPNAVGRLIAQSDLKDLGIHTEMYVDAFMDMALAGKVTNQKKSLYRGKTVFTFAAGSQQMYAYMDNNPDLLAVAVDKVNDTRVIAALDNMVAINNIIEIDLFGQSTAESVGTRHISGAGGQPDFVLGAYLSEGGKSFLCCSSTTMGKDGILKSRIVPTLATGSIVTTPRNMAQYLVTEFGMVNLKGLTTWQRAEAIISIAHPLFQEELVQQAKTLDIWRICNQ